MASGLFLSSGSCKASSWVLGPCIMAPIPFSMVHPVNTIKGTDPLTRPREPFIVILETPTVAFLHLDAERTSRYMMILTFLFLFLSHLVNFPCRHIKSPTDGMAMQESLASIPIFLHSTLAVLLHPRPSIFLSVHLPVLPPLGPLPDASS